MQSNGLILAFFNAKFLINFMQEVLFQYIFFFITAQARAYKVRGLRFLILLTNRVLVCAAKGACISNLVMINVLVTVFFLHDPTLSRNFFDDLQLFYLKHLHIKGY